MTELFRSNDSPVIKLESIPDSNYNHSSNREKIGEIYHLSPGHLTFVCSHCAEEFPLLRQFTAHIQIHLLNIYSDYIQPSSSNADELDIKPAIGSDAEACTENIELVIVDIPQNASPDYETSDTNNIIEVNKCETESNYNDLMPTIDDQSEQGPSSYECYVCRAPFANCEDCLWHIKDTHITTVCRCFICGQMFDDNLARTAHMRTHYQNIECNECGQQIGRKIPKDEHSDVSLNETNHTTEFTGVLKSQSTFCPDKKKRIELFTYTCGFCDMTFGYQSCHKKHHLRIHCESRESVKCNVCGRTVVSAHSLREHMRRHTGENLQHCTQCDYKCPYRSEMKKHMRSHSDQREFQCDLCPKTFKLEGTLKIHKRSHVNDTAVCGICKKEISSPSYLRVHMRRHTMDKLRHCPKCDYKTPSPNELARHLTTHSDRRDFHCDLCPKTFKRQHDMMTHKRNYHSDKRKKSIERNHQCEQCGERFTTNANLLRHMVKHTEERNFKCDVCPKTYKLLTKLVAHKRTHTGNFIYNCNLCNKGFVEKRSLKKHSMSAHGRPWKDIGIARIKNES